MHYFSTFRGILPSRALCRHAACKGIAHTLQLSEGHPRPEHLGPPIRQGLCATKVCSLVVLKTTGFWRLFFKFSPVGGGGKFFDNR